MNVPISYALLQCGATPLEELLGRVHVEQPARDQLREASGVCCRIPEMPWIPVQIMECRRDQWESVEVGQIYKGLAVGVLCHNKWTGLDWKGRTTYFVSLRGEPNEIP